MTTRAVLVSAALAASVAGCGDNPCERVVDAIDRAALVPGCEEYMKRFVDAEPNFNADDCTATGLEARIHDAQARCFDAVESCSVASQVELNDCLEKAYAGRD